VVNKKEKERSRGKRRKDGTDKEGQFDGTKAKKKRKTKWSQMNIRKLRGQCRKKLAAEKQKEDERKELSKMWKRERRK
jgi:hypothetical protein